MLTIGEIVRIDEHGRFRRDVQLSDYDDKHQNLALLRSYMFTRMAQAPRATAEATPIASVELLDRVVETFLHKGVPNRQVVIANYGHGKSHLALTLANYFGKPIQSDEIRTVLGRLENAANRALYSRFEDFKNTRGEFLVVRLRGDVPRSIREQFVQELEKALQEHTLTRDEQLPFWHAAAERFLERLSEESREEADAFLEERYTTDLPTLLADVRGKRDFAYDRCVEVFSHLYSVLPNFGGELSLKEAVHYAVTRFCGEGKLGGVLILFDEFSLYIQRYAQRGAVGELQDLLNGVSDHQGHVVFLAFGQQDPLTTSRNALGHDQDALETLDKELTRIDKRFILQSHLESIIDVYLRQDDLKWQALLQDRRTKGALFGDASELTYGLVFGRNRPYTQDRNWTWNAFTKTVTEGCFPLHPATTALLCNVGLEHGEDIGAPRTVLGFVMDQVHEKETELAVVDGQVNWVLPTALVDYFGARLSSQEYASYQNALVQAGEQVKVEEMVLLKALLLYRAARLSAGQHSQEEILAVIAGIDQHQARQGLQALAARNVLGFDSINKAYYFWATTVNPRKLEETIQRKLRKALSDQAIIEKQCPLHALSLAVAWGHPDDWAATQRILSASSFSAAHLKGLVRPFAIGQKSLEDGARGLVMWLLAQTENELAELRQNAAHIVDEAYSADTPLPVIAILPQKPMPEFVDALKRKWALESFTQSERQEVGPSVYAQESQRTELTLSALRATLLGDATRYREMDRSRALYVVPRAYRVRINALSSTTLNAVLQEVYALAYAYRPPEFYTHYSSGSHKGPNKLHKAAKTVAKTLLRNGVQQHWKVFDALERDLCDKFLRSKWQLLAGDNRIQAPGASGVSKAWSLLDETFPAGSAEERQVRTVIPDLLNPPYGFDCTTLTLLFTAWMGFSVRNLRISLGGRYANVDALASLIDEGKSPREFIERVCCQDFLALRRDDITQVLVDVQQVIERIYRGTPTFPQAEAAETVANLETFALDDRYPQEERERAQEAGKKLQQALADAEEYDGKAAAIQRALDHLGMTKGIQTLDQIGELPAQGIVVRSAPGPHEIRTHVIEKLDKALQTECARLESLQSISQLDLRRKELQDLEQKLQKAGLEATRVQQALQTLERHAQTLKAQADEAVTCTRIEAMSLNVTLPELHAYEAQLDEMKGLSEKTQRCREQRLQIIREEIKRLTDFAQGLTDQAAKAGDRQALRQLRERVLGLSGRFVATEFQEGLEQVKQQLESAHDYLDEINRIENAPLNKEDDAISLYRRLKKLEKRGQELGQGCCLAIQQAHERIKQRVQLSYEQGFQWLSEIEGGVAKETAPDALLRKMEDEPGFLAKDGKQRLEMLRRQVQERLERDLMLRIETNFRQLSDKDKQRECLAHLQELLEEG